MNVTADRPPSYAATHLLLVFLLAAFLAACDGPATDPSDPQSPTERAEAPELPSQPLDGERDGSEDSEEEEPVEEPPAAVEEPAAAVVQTPPPLADEYECPGHPGLSDAVLADLVYVETEILISGTPDNLDRLLREDGSSVLDIVNDMRVLCRIEGPFSRNEDASRARYKFDTLRMALPESLTVVDALTEFYTQLDLFATGDVSPDDVPVVYAEPNYILRTLQAGRVFPNNGIVPIGPKALATPPGSAANAFMSQRAFGPPNAGGIGLIGPGPGNARQVSQTGSGVEIAIFDSSPQLGDASAEMPDASQTAAVAGFDITVQRPLPATHPVSFNADTAGLGHHGLFVASIANVVAPDASIQLLDVTDSQESGLVDGLSTVDTLLNMASLYAIARFDSHGSLHDTVLNISLGDIPDSSSVSWPSGSVDGLVDALGAAITSADLDPDLLNLATYTANASPSMHALLVDVRQQGAVIVAAAGNDSDNSAPTISTSRYPAAWDFVVSVTSSPTLVDTSTTKRSCFANAGQLVAPGGGQESGTSGAVACDEDLVAERCGLAPVPTAQAVAQAEPPPCRFAITGLIDDGSTPDLDPSVDASLFNFDEGYGYWMGSSFAAPMVSGLAALIIEAKPGTVEPDDVQESLVCSATKSTGPAALPTLPSQSALDAMPTADDKETAALGVGVINVATALSTTCLQ